MALNNQVVSIAEHGFEAEVTAFVSRYVQDNNLSKNESGLRKQALSQFVVTGLPSRKLEDWKYTDLTKLSGLGLSLSNKQALVNHKYNSNIVSTVKKLVSNSQSQVTLVLLDGLYSDDLSVIGNKLNFDYVGSIDNLTSLSDKTNSDDIQLTFLKNNLFRVGDIENPMINFVNATWQDGVVIILGDKGLNTSVDDFKSPQETVNIRILNVTTSASQNKFINSKNLAYVGAGHNIDIIEEYLYINDSGELFTSPKDKNTKPLGLNISNNTNFDLLLSDKAVCRHYILQNNIYTNAHVVNYYIEQAGSSQYYQYNLNLGSGLSRCNIDVYQNQDNAVCDLYGLLLAKQAQHMDGHLKALHNASHGSSNQDYRCVLAERGHGVFNGMVYVAQDTIGNSANQSNKNILLSKHAEVDTKPELQIYADDVSCSHGATIGKLDENSLFYLRSRGIPEDQARHILIYAFINHLLDKIDSSDVKSLAEQLIEQDLKYIAGTL